jgi:hypothetical protein
VIASIEASLKSAAWRPKFVIFHNPQKQFFFFGNFLVVSRTAGGPGPFAPCLIGGHPDTSKWNFSNALYLHSKL